MLSIDFQSYSPTLRLKQGEYEATRELRGDVRARILPHWVLPPPKEPDPERRRALSNEEFIYDSASRLAFYWPIQPCLLDPRFLFHRFEGEDSKAWLHRLFAVAVDKGAMPIPVAALSDLNGYRLASFQAIAQPSAIGFAIRITLKDLGDPSLRKRLHQALLSLVAKPHECILIIDMSGVDLSQVDAIVDYIGIMYQQVSEIGRWWRVIVQSTSFPNNNPAKPGAQSILPRNEFIAWKRAVSSDDELLNNVMFGDFAADSGKFVFKGRAIPIPHYRYSLEDKWLVVRGGEGISTAFAMRDVASRLLESGLFYGRSFSKGDQYIYETANGLMGPGSATTWRKINTIHHLTRSVTDVGEVRGYQIEEAEAEPLMTQSDLFGGNH